MKLDLRDLHVYGGAGLVALGLGIVHIGLGLAVGGAILLYLGMRGN
jgi:hypothetical protein